MGVVIPMTLETLAANIIEIGEFATLEQAVGAGFTSLGTGAADYIAGQLTVIEGGAAAEVVSMQSALEAAQTATSSLIATQKTTQTASMSLLKTATGFKPCAVLSMDVGAFGAACAPVLGVALGAGLYESNPKLWTDISKKLLPFCYPGTTKIPTFLDIALDTQTGKYIYKVLTKISTLNKVKEALQENGVPTAEEPVKHKVPPGMGTGTVPGAPSGEIEWGWSGHIETINLSPVGVILDSGSGITASTEPIGASYTYDGRTAYYSEQHWIGFIRAVSGPIYHNSQGLTAGQLAWILLFGQITGYPPGTSPWAGEAAPVLPPDYPFPVITPFPPTGPVPVEPETEPLTPITPVIPLPVEPIPLFPEGPPDNWPEEDPYPPVIPFPWSPDVDDPDYDPDEWPPVIPFPMPEEPPEDWPNSPDNWPDDFPPDLPWPHQPEEWPPDVPWPEEPPDVWPEEPWPETPEEWPPEIPWPEEPPIEWNPEIPWPESPEDWPPEIPWPETKPDDWPGEWPDMPWPSSPYEWPPEVPWPVPWPPEWPDDVPWPPPWPSPIPYPIPVPSPQPSPDPDVEPKPGEIEAPNPGPEVDPYIDPTPNPDIVTPVDPQPVPGPSEDPSPDPDPGPKPAPVPYVDPSPPTPDPEPDPDPDPEPYIPIPTPPEPDPDPDPIDPDPDPPDPPPDPTPLPDGVVPVPPNPDPPPIYNASHGLITVYNPTSQEFLDFADWLWVTYADATIDKIWNNPFDGIIGAFELYCDPTYEGRKTIRSGFLDSGVYSDYISRYTEINCGTLGIPEYYGNYFDYSPYTKAHIYLPFIGIQELNVDDIVGHYVNVTYRIDEYNGSCIAMITCAKVGELNGVDYEYSNVMYQFSGTCSVEIPLTGGTQASIRAGMMTADAYQRAGQIAANSQLAGGIASFLGGLISPSPLSGLGGLVSGIGGYATQNAYANASYLQNMLGGKSTVQKSGSFGASHGAMGIKKPFIVVTRPKQIQVTNYNLLYGYPAHKMVTVGMCTGYLRCREVHVLSSTATDEEKSMIESLMKSGVYVTE